MLENKLINTTACMDCYLLGTDEEIENHRCLGVSGRFITKEEKLKKSMNKFYMIFKENGDLPKKMHETYKDASEECDRLCKANPARKFYILQAVEVREGQVEIEKLLLKETE